MSADTNHLQDTEEERALHIIEDPCPCTTLGRCDLHHYATELLEALEELLGLTNHYRYNAVTRNKAVAAVTKARGEA